MTPPLENLPRSVVIATGNELVRGAVSDRNGPLLARLLCALGWPAAGILLVDDGEAPLLAALEAASRLGAGVAIVTGGLGPTRDDQTRDAIAHFSGVGLVENMDAAQSLKAWMARRKRGNQARNMRQALLPEGADPIENPAGTAPGFHLDVRGMRVVALPGPPRELAAVIGSDLTGLARWIPDRGQALAVRRLDTFGLPESTVDGLLDPVRTVEGITVGTLAGEGAVSVVLAGRGNEADRALDEADALAARALGPHLFGRGGATLPEVLVDRLLRKGLTVALAESCTGGLVGDMLTDVPGVSAALLEGFITYSNDAKTKRLGVPTQRIADHGAVSPEVASDMAQGAATASGASLSLAVTGIAGPGGGTLDKPVGRVYVAVCFEGRTHVRRLDLGGLDRARVRRISALSVIDLARRAVEGIL